MVILATNPVYHFMCSVNDSW